MSPYETSVTLEQIKYKPGWKLHWAYSWDGSHVSIWWDMHVPDAFDFNEMKTFASAVVKVTMPADEEGLVRDAYRLALRAEEHEAAEFFTYQGRRPFDPHRSVLYDGERYG